MKHIERIQKYVNKNWLYLLPSVIFIFVSIVLIAINRSFIFEREFISQYGDQQLYYKLARGVLNGEFPKSPYTLGYPLLYMPLLLMTGVKESWTSIMPLAISLQAFVLMPMTLFLVFKDKSRKWLVYSFAGLCTYYGLFFWASTDTLMKYNFFGLIPLSEPLAIFCLISGYYVYLKYLQTDTPRLRYLVLFAALFAWSIMTRSTSIILYLPLFIELLLDKRFKPIAIIGGVSALWYAPQIAYNYLCSGDPLFNGYVWWANGKVAKNTNNIESLYGFRSSAMFSVRYLAVNIKDLALEYVPFLTLCGVVALKRNRLVALVLGCSLLNLVFHLAYWWSNYGGLLHRFLLPNIFLLLFVFRNELVFGRAKDLGKKLHSAKR